MYVCVCVCMYVFLLCKHAPLQLGNTTSLVYVLLLILLGGEAEVEDALFSATPLHVCCQ